jgi:ASCH domain
MRWLRRRQAPKAKWTRELAKLRALTIRQPWAWLIVNGYKDIENRSWQTRHRGALLIHAGASKTDLRESVLTDVAKRYGIQLPQSYVHGGVIGVVDVVECKKRTASPWHRRGSIGWVLERPRRLLYRPCKGALGLFRPKFQKSRK